MVSAGVVDQNQAHQPGRDPEKVRPVLKPHRLRLVEQSQISFVDQRRRLQRLAGTAPSQISSRQLVKLSINLRRQLFERVRLASSPGNQERGNGRRSFHPRNSPTMLAVRPSLSECLECRAYCQAEIKEKKTYA